MSTKDDKLLSTIRRELDTDLDRLDSSVLATLRHNRREVLRRPGGKLPLIARIAPAFAFAASMIMFVLLLRVPGYSSLQVEPDNVLPQLDFSDSEIELVDELEFFRWLDANGHAG